jgi:hypothetical protein
MRWHALCTVGGGNRRTAHNAHVEERFRNGRPNVATPEFVKAEILEIMKNELDLNEGDFDGFDSLDWHDLAYRVETRFDVRLPAIDSVASLQDFSLVVAGLINLREGDEVGPCNDG